MSNLQRGSPKDWATEFLNGLPNDDEMKRQAAYWNLADSIEDSPAILQTAVAVYEIAASGSVNFGLSVLDLNFLFAAALTKVALRQNETVQTSLRRLEDQFPAWRRNGHASR